LEKREEKKNPLEVELGFLTAVSLLWAAGLSKKDFGFLMWHLQRPPFSPGGRLEMQP
jgi:hypothetical protein